MPSDGDNQRKKFSLVIALTAILALGVFMAWVPFFFLTLPTDQSDSDQVSFWTELKDDLKNAFGQLGEGLDESAQAINELKSENEQAVAGTKNTADETGEIELALIAAATAEWQAYENPTYGFALKHPLNTVATTSTNELVSIINTNNEKLVSVLSTNSTSTIILSNVTKPAYQDDTFTIIDFQQTSTTTLIIASFNLFK